MMKVIFDSRIQCRKSKDEREKLKNWTEKAAKIYRILKTIVDKIHRVV